MNFKERQGEARNPTSNPGMNTSSRKAQTGNQEHLHRFNRGESYMINLVAFYDKMTGYMDQW